MSGGRTEARKGGYRGFLDLGAGAASLVVACEFWRSRAPAKSFFSFDTSSAVRAGGLRAGVSNWACAPVNDMPNNNAGTAIFPCLDMGRSVNSAGSPDHNALSAPKVSTLRDLHHGG